MISIHLSPAVRTGVGTILMLSLAATAASANPLFCLPLHGYDGTVGCDAGPLEYCSGPATVSPNSLVTVLLLTYYFDSLASVQAAFEWDAGWTFLYSTWDCLPGQTTLAVPHSPGGAEAGTVYTAFDCLTEGGWFGPAPVIGRLFFMSGNGGCVRLVESAYLYGTHVTDCQGWDYRIRSDDWWLRTGVVCAGPGGYDGCWDPNPVEPSTWGEIKATWGNE